MNYPPMKTLPIFMTAAEHESFLVASQKHYQLSYYGSMYLILMAESENFCRDIGCCNNYGYKRQKLSRFLMENPHTISI